MTEKITLQTNNKEMTCEKSLLMQQSDYFRAMLGGQFIESNKSHIKLEEVDEDSLEKILLHIQHKTPFRDEDLIEVLRTSSVLQFTGIQSRCLKELRKDLSVGNCLKVWMIAEELAFKTLEDPARMIALENFNDLIASQHLAELDYGFLLNYLGSVHLKCAKEHDVFTAILNWLEENTIDDKAMWNLLLCVDYSKMSSGELELVINEPLIACYKDVFTIFKNRNETNEKIEQLRKCKGRKNEDFLCISCISSTAIFGHAESFNTVLYFDPQTRIFEKLTTSCEVWPELRGCQIVSYKGVFFVFGGKYDTCPRGPNYLSRCLTRGRCIWHNNVSCYDPFTDIWADVLVLPHSRHHFETCILDDNIYVVGGTGKYHLEKTMYYINLNTKFTSNLIQLPCPAHQIKACIFQKKVFLLQITLRQGFFFDPSACLFTTIPIKAQDEDFQRLNQYSLIPHYNSLFLIGSKVIRLELQNDYLTLTSHSKELLRDYDRIDSVLYNDIIYSIIFNNNTHQFLMVSYNINNNELEILQEKIVENNVIYSKGCKFILTRLSKVFGFPYCTKSKSHELINDCIQSC